MANNRIFYAMQGVLLLEVGTTEPTANSPGSDVPFPQYVYGAQEVGITTNFNLEDLFELGQLSLYQNIEEVPDVEVSLEKVLDGRPLIYHMATPKASGPGLTGRAGVNDKCDMRMGITRDTDVGLDANAELVGEVYASGMYVSDISYSLTAEGNSTESVTLVGNNKTWEIGTIMSGNMAMGLDAPSWSAEQGDLDTVIRRQHFNVTDSLIPIDIPGYSTGDLSGAAALDYSYKLGASNGKTHITSVSISTSLGRTPLFELGRKAPYYRSADFPVDVTCDIEVISLSGDFLQRYEEGFATADTPRGISVGDNLGNRRIELFLDDGTVFNLGTKNKLQTVSYGNAGTGGGNATMTFSYKNSSDLEVLHSGDPAVMGQANSVLGMKSSITV
jgi:hypothetical protein